MKYQIGTMVYLNNGKTVYITDFNKDTNKYRGFDAEENNPQKIIEFSESQVLMKV